MWKHNSLSIVVAALFLICLAGHSVSGWKEYNSEQRDHGRPEVSYTGFLGTSEFGETVFENWESEFFQMGFYVVLTVFLRQKGSSESKKLDEKEEVDDDPRDHAGEPGAPAPVRRGGWQLALYRNSLSLAFFVLFLLSFAGHAWAGAKKYNEHEHEHGKPTQLTTAGYMKTSQFWYESFQNWQSEFLAVLSIVVLSIHLRQHGSPESKPVHASHESTGTS
jgi:hypothetical protein